jgi:hypothetical protein
MYLLQEYIMNGTITLKTIGIIVKAENFNEAKNKIKESLEKQDIKFNISKNNDKDFSYFINNRFPTYGEIKNKEIDIIE